MAALLASTMVVFAPNGPLAVAATSMPRTVQISAGTGWGADVEEGLQQSCADVLIVVAQSTGDSPLDAGGLGASARSTIDSVLPQLSPELVVRQVAASGLTSGVDQLNGELLANVALDPVTSPFLAPALSVAGDIERLLLDSAERCAFVAEAVLLVGVGQGAVATRWALRNGSVDRSLLAHISIGDPYRNDEDPTTHPGVRVGDAAGSVGILTTAAQHDRAPRSPILSRAVIDATADLCFLGDGYCTDSGNGVVAPTDDELSGVAAQVAARADGYFEPLREEIVVEGGTETVEQIDLRPPSQAFLPAPGIEWRLSPSEGAAATNGLALVPTGEVTLFNATEGVEIRLIEARSANGLWIPIRLVVETVPSTAVPSSRGGADVYPPQSSDDADLQQCADLLFVGVRGSGQTTAEGAGYGPEISIARDGFMDGIASDVRVREVYLDYPAIAALPQVFLPDFTSDTLRTQFDTSVAAGVEQLVDTLIDSYQNCSDERWVLGGYSQGALVVHKSVQVLDGPASERVATLLLLANPARHEADDSQQLGTSTPSGHGIANAITDPLPAWAGVRTVSLCTIGDLVCEWASVDLANPTAVHTSYRFDYPLVWTMGDIGSTVHERVAGWAGPNPLDRARLVHGVESSRGTSMSNVELVVAADGRQDLFWIESDYTRSWWGTTRRLMTTSRASSAESWAPPQVAHEIGHRLRMGNFSSMTTSDGHSVVMWEESVEQGWSQYGSSKWGDSTLRAITRASGASSFSVPTTVFTSRFRDYSSFRFVRGHAGEAALHIRTSPTGAGNVPDELPRGDSIDVALLDQSTLTWGDLATLSTDVEGASNLMFGSDGAIAVIWNSSTETRDTVGGVPIGTMLFRHFAPGSTSWSEPRAVPLPARIRNQTATNRYDLVWTYSRMTASSSSTMSSDGTVHLLTHGRQRFGSSWEFEFELSPGGDWLEMGQGQIQTSTSSRFETTGEGISIRLATESVAVYSSSNPLPAGRWLTAFDRPPGGGVVAGEKHL